VSAVEIACVYVNPRCKVSRQRNVRIWWELDKNQVKGRRRPQLEAGEGIQDERSTRKPVNVGDTNGFGFFI